MFIINTKLISSIYEIGEISSLGKSCLLPLHTILNDPKTNLLGLLALITSIIPLFKDKWYILSHHIRTKFSIFICFESKGVSLWGLFIFHITHYCPPHNENRHFENIGQILSIIFMLPLLQLVLDVLKPSEQNAKSIAKQNSKQSLTVRYLTSWHQVSK